MQTQIKKQPVMTWGQGWAYLTLLTLGTTLTLVFGVWWFNLSHIPNNFSGYWHVLDIGAFMLLSYVVWYQICYELFIWYISLFMREAKSTMHPPPGLRVALVTAFVPGKEPYEVLEETLKAMVAVDYPHDTWVLDEGNDPTTIALCQTYGALHFSRKGKPHFNTEEGSYKARTKGGNYNAWFDSCARTYDIVAQHDVDFVPNKNFLMRTLGYFNDPEVAFVGTPQIYGNTDESWIARGAAEQAYPFYGLIQRGLDGHGMSLFIGANHIIRVAAHDDIEGYAGHIVEDHLTGMRLYAKRWKSVYVPEILAVGEGPSTWGAYFSQQMRWAYGLFDILFRHSPKTFLKMRLNHIFNYVFLQHYYFYGVTQLIGIFLISLYTVFGFQSTSMPIRELVMLYVPLIIFQLVIFFWLQRFYVDPKNEGGWLWRGRLLNLAVWPIYCLAFWKAIRGKRLVYSVTPKGAGQEDLVNVSLFIPHFILGSITAFDLVAASVTHHAAPQILIWAILNSVVMYFFFFSAALNNVYYLYLKPALSYLFSRRAKSAV